MSPRPAFLPLLVSIHFLMAPTIHGGPPAPGGAKRPETNRRVRTDHYGDPLPKGVRYRLGTVRLRHDAAATAVAWLPDGRTLASAGGDDSVRLWQIPGGKQRARWDKMKSAVFSPDGRTLAYGGGDGRIHICDLASGKEIRRVRVPKTGVQPGVFSPDGKTLAAFDWESRNKVRLYATDTGKEVGVLTSGQMAVFALAFSSDSKTLAAVTDGSGAFCWDVSTGKKLRPLGSEGQLSVAFSPDSKMLAAVTTDGLHSAVRLWSWPAGKELRRIDVEGYEPDRVTFSPDGKTLATGDYYGIRVWDPTTGKELRRLEGHQTAVLDLAFSPDGSLLASAGDDGTVTVWETRAKKTPRPLTGVGHRLDAVAVTGDCRTLLTHARDGALTLWDGRNGRPVRTLAYWTGVYWSGGAMTFLVAPDGRRALALRWFGVPPVWWDLASGRRLPAFSGLKQRVSCAAFSPDGAVLALGDFDGFSGFIQLRDAARGGELRRLKEGKDVPIVCELAFSPDGRTLAASHIDGSLTLWDLRTSLPRHRLSGPRIRHSRGLTFSRLTFSSDSRLLAVVWGNERSIRLYEAVSGQEVRQLRGHPASIRSLAFAPDSRTLASASELGLDRANEAPRPLPFGNPEAAIRLWDVAGGKQIHLLPGHQGTVYTLAFSPDGSSLISGSDDNTVLCWDVADVMRRRPAGKELSAARLAELWSDLASKDAARAQRAVAELIQAPDAALPFLAKMLPPVPPAEMARVAALIAELDHEQFARRETASKELEKIGEPAAPVLRRALEKKPTLEVRKRIMVLLEVIDRRPPSPERLRVIRALQALEGIGSPKAKAVLEGLAGGAAGAGPTEEARAALRRLARRKASVP